MARRHTTQRGTLMDQAFIKAIGCPAERSQKLKMTTLMVRPKKKKSGSRARLALALTVRWRVQGLLRLPRCRRRRRRQKPLRVRWRAQGLLRLPLRREPRRRRRPNTRRPWSDHATPTRRRGFGGSRSSPTWHQIHIRWEVRRRMRRRWPRPFLAQGQRPSRSAHALVAAAPRPGHHLLLLRLLPRCRRSRRPLWCRRSRRWNPPPFLKCPLTWA